MDTKMLRVFLFEWAAQRVHLARAEQQLAQHELRNASHFCNEHDHFFRKYAGFKPVTELKSVRYALDRYKKLEQGSLEQAQEHTKRSESLRVPSSIMKLSQEDLEERVLPTLERKLAAAHNLDDMRRVLEEFLGVQLSEVGLGAPDSSATD